MKHLERIKLVLGLIFLSYPHTTGLIYLYLLITSNWNGIFITLEFSNLIGRGPEVSHYCLLVPVGLLVHLF